MKEEGIVIVKKFILDPISIHKKTLEVTASSLFGGIAAQRIIDILDDSLTN